MAQGDAALEGARNPLRFPSGLYGKFTSGAGNCTVSQRYVVNSLIFPHIRALWKTRIERYVDPFRLGIVPLSFDARCRFFIVDPGEGIIPQDLVVA